MNKKIKKAIIMMLIIIITLLNFGCLNGILAKSLLQPKRHPITKNPEDYQMNYQNIEFKSIDGVKLKGWLISGALIN